MLWGAEEQAGLAATVAEGIKHFERVAFEDVHEHVGTVGEVNEFLFIVM